MSSVVTYCDVLLPLALPQRYSYAIPFDLVEFVRIGQRVIVQFGKNKYYSAIVCNIHHRKPAFDAKLIDSIADEFPIVTTTQLQFWKWMSDYYMSTEGEVMSAALPEGLKLNSETKIVFNEQYSGDYDSLSGDEFLIVQMLKAQREITITQIQKALAKKHVYRLLKPIFNLGIAFTAEEFVPKYKTKTENYIRLATVYEDAKKLEDLFGELNRAPKQCDLLLSFLQISKQTRFVRRAELLAKSGASATILNGLLEKKVFEQVRVEVSRLGTFYEDSGVEINLSEAQQTAMNAIEEQFESKQTVLLHGVTGSGKTEIYIQLIKKQLEAGKQILYLLPEIALTAQIINRLKNYFGSVLGVYHSKFNLHERVEIWHKVLSGEYKIIVAARSGIFLPFQQLGLLIVDEEHDSSYKQTDPSPRYHARDAGIILANLHQAKVLLGSATPSLETLYNCEKQKFGLVRLEERFAAMEMPEVKLENMKFILKKGETPKVFSDYLLNEIQAQLNEKKQVILFHNRRGFSSYQMCKTCQHIYKCKYCDVSLTYHKFQHKLVCHYCGYQEKIEQHCVACGAPDLDIIGNGTEKIEEEIAAQFPKAKVGRLDLDSVRGKHAHEHIISSFENHEIDILVGTQMVSKGLDFDDVGLVGVIQADMLLNYPGFRSHEKAFQLLTQVSGRAGRKNKRGKVIIQTNSPDSYVLHAVVAHDFNAVKAMEMQNRQQFHYPPFCRMIQLRVQEKNVIKADKAILYLANAIRKLNQSEVLGPSSPLVSKVNNYYLRDVMVKTNGKTKDLGSLKIAIRSILDDMKSNTELKSIRVLVDVDPA